MVFALTFGMMLGSLESGLGKLEGLFQVGRRLAKRLSGSHQLAVKLLIFRDVPERSCKPNQEQGRYTCQERRYVPLARP